MSGRSNFSLHRNLEFEHIQTSKDQASSVRRLHETESNEPIQICSTERANTTQFYLAVTQNERKNAAAMLPYLCSWLWGVTSHNVNEPNVT